MTFDRCHRSWAAATPVRCDRDIEKETSVLMVLKNGKNNRAEEMSLVTPTPGDMIKTKQMHSTVYILRSIPHASKMTPLGYSSSHRAYHQARAHRAHYYCRYGANPSTLRSPDIQTAPHALAASPSFAVFVMHNKSPAPHRVIGSTVSDLALLWPTEHMA